MTVRILVGDALERLRELPDQSVQCVVTSPPYFHQRDYKVDGQIGLEPRLADYIGVLITVFNEVRRVLRDDGCCFVNLGDSYHTDSPVRTSSSQAFSDTWDPSQTASRGGSRRSAAKSGVFKNKDLMMVPHRFAIAMQEAGWWVRNDLVWGKLAPMPESVTDRATRAHEYVFHFTKSAKYFYDAAAVREPLKLSSLERLSQDVESQTGSVRANGGAKTNGTMKAVMTGGPRTNPDRRPSRGVEGKQRGHGRRHDGFNDRWDSMTKEEQQAGGANQRSIWMLGPDPYSGNHYAVMPREVARRCIKAGSKVGDTVLDPFAGVGTTGLVADELERDAILIELNPESAAEGRARIHGACPMFATVDVA